MSLYPDEARPSVSLPADSLLTIGPSAFQPPDGFRFVEGFFYAPYFDTPDDMEVSTLSFDCVASSIIGLQVWGEVITKEVVPRLLEAGEELMAWSIWEKEIFDVTVPERFCIAGHCVDVPLIGGTTIVSAYRYYIWILSRPTIAPSLEVRPAIPAVIAFAIAIAIIVGVGVFIGWFETKTGIQIFGSLRRVVEDVVRGFTPGQIVQTGIQPLVLLGGLFLAGSFVLAIASMKAGQPPPALAPPPIPGFEVKAGPVGVSVTPPRAPAPPPAPRRRR